MNEAVFMGWILGVLILLFTAMISSVVFGKLNFPYTIGLVISGVIIEVIFNDFTNIQPIPFDIFKDIIFYILLPVLIFDAAIRIDLNLFIKNIKPIFVLAAPGLIVSTLVTGALTAWLTPLSLGSAMVFGAMISATDPVAVISFFKTLGAPKRLTMLVDGESLLNDATAIVTYRIVLGIVLAGTAAGWTSVLRGGFDFVIVFAGGFFTGAIISYIMLRLANKYSKYTPLTHRIALSVFIAYSSFIAADYLLNLSGVMAAMGAGITAAWYVKTRIKSVVKVYISSFWEFAAFMANSFIFLIVGIFGKDLLVKFGDGSRLTLYILAAYFAATAARAVIVYGLTSLSVKGSEPVSVKEKHIMFWGGLRGAVALGLSLSLPEALPGRDLIVACTIGTVLLSLFIQGTTIKKLINYLGVTENNTALKE